MYVYLYANPQVKFRKDINQIAYSDFFWEKEQS